MKTIIALCVGLMLSVCVWGLDANGHYNIVGVGVYSCGQYLELYDGYTIPEKQTATNMIKWGVMQGWLTGYLTGFNYAIADTYSIVGKHFDEPSLFLHIQNYCKDEPLHNVATALEITVKSLWRNRVKAAPK